MSALTRVFFRPPAAIPESAGAVIDWWESRRPIYNVAVGATGVVTLGIMNVMLALPPHAQPLPAALNVIGALAFGVAANFCYSGGWAAELLLRRWLGEDSVPLGAALFRYGVAFSIGLTLFPAGLTILHWLARVADAVL
jgi:hypothetical protein